MRSIPRIVALLLVTGLALAARAADPLLDEGFTASIGTFVLDTKTVVRVDGTVTSGDNVDLEKELGLDSSVDQLRLDMTWRFAPKHAIRGMWFSNTRSATTTLAQAITIGDTTYPAGSTVDTTMDLEILEIAYEYSFWRGDDYEVTGTAGLHTIVLDFDIDGAVDTPSEAKVTGPLPVFGARGIWRYAPDWYLEGQAQFFGLEYGNIKGRLDDYKVTLTWMATPHVGVGAGWNQFSTRIESNDPAFEGVLRWRYGGPMVFVTGAL